MSNWNRLQVVLDAIFSHGSKKTSRLTKRYQGFDNKTGEHVVIIEYRLKMLNEAHTDDDFPVLSRYARALEREV